MASRSKDPAKAHAQNRRDSLKKKRPPSEKVQKRHAIVLSSYRLGMTVADACAQAGVTENAHWRWCSDYPGYKTEYERAKAIRSGKISTAKRPFDAAFRKEFFGFDTASHHQEMIDLISSMGPAEVGAIFMPPEHAKTTMMEDYICWRVAMDPNVRVLIVSKSQKHAQKMLGRIQWRLTDRNYLSLQEQYGPFKDERRQGRPWTASYFTVVKQDSGERDYTVEAVGIGGHVYGTRSDLIVIDDIAEPSNQTTGQIEDQMEWLQLVVGTRIGTKGNIIFVGTRIREEDVYSKLEDTGFFDHVKRMPALLREPGTESPEDPGESLWPEQWPPDKLIKLRRNRMDPRIWALSYQQEAIPSEGASFPMEIIEDCFDASRKVGDIPPNCSVVVGIDPAAVNYTAGVAVAIDNKTKMRYVLDVWNHKNLMGDGGDRLEGLVQFIVELCRAYRAKVCCIETNNMQSLITSSLTLRREMSAIGARIIPFQSGRGESDDLAVQQLSVLFANKMVNIPYQGRSVQQMSQFIHQFAVWRPGDKKLTRDIVKAFQFAEHAVRHVQRNETSQDTTFDDVPLYLLEDVT